MILILSNRDDEHVLPVERILRQRNASFERFDPVDFPRRAGFALRHDGERASMCLVRDEASLDLTSVGAAWWRRPSAPQAHPSLVDGPVRRYAALEFQLCAEGLWEALDCFWLPSRHIGVRSADQKLKQLVCARSVGLTVPPTLLTNDPASALAFYEEHQGQLISKVATPAVFWSEPRVAVRYTQPVTRGDLSYWPMLRYAPVVLQPRLPKAHELRVTVVGDRVFTACVQSQQNWRSVVDSRMDFARTPYEAHTLDAAIEESCRALVRRLGLSYGTLDFIVTPAGEHLFLELNPSGQYLWIEERTGLAISEAVAELLIDKDREHERTSTAH